MQLLDSNKASKHSMGEFRPVIDCSKCEGDGDCVKACPNSVFEISPLTSEEKHKLPLFSRLKVVAHGGKQAKVIHPESCEGCGDCVSACHEKAIKLRRVN